MTAIIILNIVFAAAVIIGIVGLLAHSIRTDNAGASLRPVRSEPRRRDARASAPSRSSAAPA